MPARARPMISVPATFEDEWPSGSALATECCMNLGVLAGGATGAMQALVDRHGVPSLAAFNVLAILEGAAMALPPSVIADRMLVSRAT
ncbi:MAG: hypothetical protein QOG64_3055, partial [Acidimicrobiaceae bacterium]|nr:hypothetical protein [Acidimicrobiaceae bacterium]